MRKVAGAFLLALSVAGCTTGHNFTAPASENLALGQTMRAEILRLYGEPFKQTSAVLSAPVTVAQTRGEFDATPVSGTLATLVYLYQDRTGGAFAGGARTKVASFDFWNEVLVAYNFVSDFSNDSSNFDDSKIVDIHKGLSSKSDVTQLFGPPTGRAIYPAIQHQGHEKFIYSYIEVRGGHRSLKRLEVLFGDDGKTLDYRFVADTSPLPAAPAPSTAPVFIPRGK